MYYFIHQVTNIEETTHKRNGRCSNLGIKTQKVNFVRKEM